jgi:hypothetical protein
MKWNEKDADKQSEIEDETVFSSHDEAMENRKNLSKA